MYSGIEFLIDLVIIKKTQSDNGATTFRNPFTALKKDELSRSKLISLDTDAAHRLIMVLRKRWCRWLSAKANLNAAISIYTVFCTKKLSAVKLCK